MPITPTNPLAKLPPPPQGQTGVTLNTLKGLPPPPAGKVGISPHQDPYGFVKQQTQQQTPQSNVGGFGFIHDLAEPLVHAGIRTGQALSELIKPGSSEQTTNLHIPLLGDYQVAPPKSLEHEVGEAVQLPALALDSPVAAGAACPRARRRDTKAGGQSCDSTGARRRQRAPVARPSGWP